MWRNPRAPDGPRWGSGALLDRYTLAVRVDQVIPSLASRDAVGVSTLTITQTLREAGIASEIYYGTCTPDVAELAHPVAELGRAGKDRWLLYQASIGSPVYDILATRSEPKLVNYHNITPAELMREWEPHIGYEVELGRTQLARLAPESRFAIADSAYNEAELLELGYDGTAVLPLLIDMAGSHAEPDVRLGDELVDRKAQGGADLLYVGKIAPWKAPHDLVKMLVVYRRLYDPRARLTLVGGTVGSHYGPALDRFIHSLGLDDAVIRPGSITDAALEAYWRAADVYVSASEHEGFCVPIVEAMAHRVPVVAYGVTAVPETVGDAGLCLPSKEPLPFAAAVARVLHDAELAATLRQAAGVRAAHFALDRSKQRLVELVSAATAA
jgi:L-malate glycosyltransferase